MQHNFHVNDNVHNNFRRNKSATRSRIQHIPLCGFRNAYANAACASLLGARMQASFIIAANTRVHARASVPATRARLSGNRACASAYMASFVGRSGAESVRVFASAWQHTRRTVRMQREQHEVLHERVASVRAFKLHFNKFFIRTHIMCIIICIFYIICTLGQAEKSCKNMRLLCLLFCTNLSAASPKSCVHVLCAYAILQSRECTMHMASSITNQMCMRRGLSVHASPSQARNFPRHTHSAG